MPGTEMTTRVNAASPVTVCCELPPVTIAANPATVLLVPPVAAGAVALLQGRLDRARAVGNAGDELVDSGARGFS